MNSHTAEEKTSTNESQVSVSPNEHLKKAQMERLMDRNECK